MDDRNSRAFPLVSGWYDPGDDRRRPPRTPRGVGDRATAAETRRQVETAAVETRRHFVVAVADVRRHFDAGVGQTHRHFDVAVESMQAEVQTLAAGLGARVDGLEQKVDRKFARVEEEFAEMRSLIKLSYSQLDRRVEVLEGQQQ